MASTHLGIRRFECDTCYASFSSKQNLNVHKFRHRRTENWESLPQGVGEVESIPMLTDLVRMSKDADLRPYSKVVKLYPFPAIQGRICLPKLGSYPQGSQTLPPPL